MSSLKVLIIGGTEFFGKILSSKLLDSGHQLTLLTRGNNRPLNLWSKVEHLLCDREDRNKFEEKLYGRDFDVVIDNVVSGVEDIKSILNVFAKRESPPHYILCSSVAVYSGEPSTSNGYTETDAVLNEMPGDDWKIQYANGKRFAEKYLINNSGNMPYTIMRPTVIEGEGDPHKRTWFWIQRIKDGGPIILSEDDVNTTYRHVYSEDVAKAFELVIGNKQTFNQIYNVAGKDVLNITQYVSIIGSILNKNQLKLCWLAAKEVHQSIPDYCLPPFFQNVQLVPDISRIQQDLGFTPTSTEGWLRRIIAFYDGCSLGSWEYDKRQFEVELSQKNTDFCTVINLKDSFLL